MRTLRPLLTFEAQRQVASSVGSLTRTVVPAVALVLMTLIYVTSLVSVGGVGGIGSVMVASIIGVNYLLLVTTALPLFCGSVTEEREAETLPLLVVAGVPLRSIVAGKGLMRLLPIVAVVVVQVPLLLGAFGFGGFTLDQVAGSIVLLLSLTAAVFGCGLLASTLCFRGSTATAIVLGVLLLVEAGPPLAGYVAANLQLPGWLLGPVATLKQMREFSTALQLLDIAVVSMPQPVWTTLSTLHGIVGAGAAALAVLLAEPWLQRTFRVEPKVPRPLGVGRTTRRLRGDAVVAREFRFGVGGRNGLLLRLLGYGVGVAAVYGLLFHTAWIPPWLSDRGRWEVLLQTPLVIFAFDLWIRSGRLLARESIDRTLAPIVLTGVAIPSLIVRKLIASLSLVLPAAAAFVVVVAISDWSVVRSGWRTILDGDVFTLVGVLQAACFAHLTMAASLRRPLQAFAIGLGIGLVTLAGLALVGGIAQTLIDSRDPAARVAGLVLLYGSGLELIAAHLWTVSEAAAVAGES